MDYYGIHKELKHKKDPRYWFWGLMILVNISMIGLVVSGIYIFHLVTSLV